MKNFFIKIWNIITFQDVNIDGKVDIIDKFVKAKKKSKK